jgi:hypothetical protein
MVMLRECTKFAGLLECAGVLVIEETGDRKNGKETAHVGYQYLSSIRQDRQRGSQRLVARSRSVGGQTLIFCREKRPVLVILNREESATTSTPTMETEKRRSRRAGFFSACFGGEEGKDVADQQFMGKAVHSCQSPVGANVATQRIHISHYSY